MKNITKTESRLREIVAEEVAIHALTESIAVDKHEEIKDVVGVASKLLSAIANFEEAANKPCQDAVSPAIDNVRSALAAMIDNPANYLKIEPKVVTLKPVEA